MRKVRLEAPGEPNVSMFICIFINLMICLRKSQGSPGSSSGVQCVCVCLHIYSFIDLLDKVAGSPWKHLAPARPDVGAHHHDLREPLGGLWGPSHHVGQQVGAHDPADSDRVHQQATRSGRGRERGRFCERDCGLRYYRGILCGRIFADA